MSIPVKRLIGTLGLSLFLFSFQSISVFAKDLTEVTLEQANLQSEYFVSQDSIINAEVGIVVPKLIIEDGVEIVEVNADIQQLEVATQNNFELKGKGNIDHIVISSSSEIAINTTGNINKIEVTNKDARLVIKEGTKIAELIIPEGSSAKDIITNFDQVKDRFENISGGIVNLEPAPVEEVTPTIPKEDDESDFDFEGEKGNSTLTVELVEEQITQIGIIPSGISNIIVELFSDVDVDLEIWDEETGTPVLAYGNPDSVQGNSASQVTWTYKGLEFVYSGWQGVNGEVGNEWLIIKGTTDRNYKIQVNNWGTDTTATVNYSWGNEEEVLPAIEENTTIVEDSSTIGNETELPTELD